MNINTYDLVLDNETKHCSLRLKESLPYKGEYRSEPLQIVEMVKELFRVDEMADEFAYLIAFNGRMKVLGVFEIGHGTGNACLLDARGIFMRAVYTGASCVVLVHTHPSGDTTPSRQDSELTAKIRDAGELIGILSLWKRFVLFFYFFCFGAFYDAAHG